MSDVCVECPHFHNWCKPIRDKGAIWDSGFAECDIYDVCIDYVSTSQLNRLRCVAEQMKEQKNDN